MPDRKKTSERPPPPKVEKEGMPTGGEGSGERRGPRQPREYPDLVDETLNDSFPASDPPSWTGP